MRISRSWLSDYVEFDDLSNADFEDLITTKVAEAEGLELLGKPLEKAVVALVKQVSRHPKRENLAVVQISTGAAEATVVCGAPNVREGMLTVFLPPGGVIRPLGGSALVNVEARDVGGVQSNGVLVSEGELEIGGDESGILELTAALGVKPGESLTKLAGGSDAIIVIDNKSLTHRPDLWSHIGFAREIAAILGRKLKRNPDDWADCSETGKKLLNELHGAGKGSFTVAIAAGTPCRRFAGIELRGARVEPSPLWMRRRLYSIGAGVRNLLVDLSNYCMHDLGQPNHAYDADRLSAGAVQVRLAQKDELFHGLDGEERKLSVEDIVIANGGRAVALGGVIGGAACSIGETTTRLFLESANFDPTVVRLTTKRHALRTDASNRFEKSLSPFQVPLALQRFAELLRAAQPSVEIVGQVADAFVEVPKPLSISLSFDYIRERLGDAVPDKTINGILGSLGFGIEAQKGSSERGAQTVAVPYFRATRDVTIPDDLVEEVGRIYGYGAIPEKAPTVECVVPKSDPIKLFEYRIADTLCGAGFSEVQNYSFTNRERAEALGYSLAEGIELQNPIDSTAGHMRVSLVPGMIDLLSKNARFFDAVSIFELGRAYETTISAEHKALKLRRFAKNPPAEERRLLTIGHWDERNAADRKWSAEPFYAVSELLERIARFVSAESLKLIPFDAGKTAAAVSPPRDFSALKPWMHPCRAATIALRDRKLGVIAEVNPAIEGDVLRRSVIAEIDLELLLEVDTRPLHFKPLARFPDSFFEMSVVMPERTHYSELESLLRGGVKSSLLRRIEVLDLYRGKPLKAEEKSISVKLFLGADDRTLSGEELKQIQEGLIGVVRGSSFSLRG